MSPDEQTYYATKSARGVYFYASPNKWWVELHGSADPIIAVRLRARTGDDEKFGRYWGWLETGESEYTMVWPSKNQLDMCFPDGIRGAEQRGRGRAVNLFIEEIVLEK